MKTCKGRFLLLMTTVFLVLFLALTFLTVSVNAETEGCEEIPTNESDYIVDTNDPSGNSYRPAYTNKEHGDMGPLKADDDYDDVVKDVSGSDEPVKTSDGSSVTENSEIEKTVAGEVDDENQTLPVYEFEKQLNAGEENDTGNAEIKESKSSQSEPRDMLSSFDAIVRPIAVFDNELQESDSYLGGKKRILVRNRGSTSCGVIARIMVDGVWKVLFEEPYLLQGGGETYINIFEVCEDCFRYGVNSIYVSFDYGGLKENVEYELLLNVKQHTESNNSAKEHIDNTEYDDENGSDEGFDSSYRTSTEENESSTEIASVKSVKAATGDSSADSVETGNKNPIYWLLVVTVMAVMYILSAMMIRCRRRE